MASLIHFNLGDPEWVLPDRTPFRTMSVFPESARVDA